MILQYITIGVLGAMIEVATITVVYLIGKQDGYWKRVQEEKDARGIR